MKKITFGKCFICLLGGLILSGCELYLPAGSVRRYEADGTFIVKKGDTIYSLARKNKVPLRDFIQFNNLEAPYKLRVGERLRIPKTKGIHVVQKGDTLYSISQERQVSLSALVQANHLKSPYQIQAGQVLNLPQSLAKRTKSVFVSQPKKSRSVSYVPPRSKTGKKSASARKKNASQPVYYAPPSSGKFILPVRGKIISSFGPQGKGKHNDGINIASKQGTTVKSAQNGVVVYVGDDLKSFGNLILIKHAKGFVTAYAHLDKTTVKKGEKVKKGDKIATVGTTGHVKTPQIHFELRKGTKVLNPLKYAK